MDTDTASNDQIRLSLQREILHPREASGFVVAGIAMAGVSIFALDLTIVSAGGLLVVIAFVPASAWFAQGARDPARHR